MLKMPETRMEKLPQLSEEELEDACFRARDRAWAAVAGQFQDLAESEGLTYETLAKRIGRKRSQVHRWLNSACNMTLGSVGLLAEGMNSDIDISVAPRPQVPTNRCHPAESAAIQVKIRQLSDVKTRPVRESVSSRSMSVDFDVDQIAAS